MMKATLMATTCAWLLWAGPALAASTPAQKCQAAKNRAVGRYANCLQRAQAMFVTNGDSGKLSAAVTRCIHFLDTRWDAREATAATAGDPCPTTHDRALVRGFVKKQTQTLAAALQAGNSLFTLGVDMTNADIHGADISNLDLTGVDLTGVNLVGGNASGATLINATLTNTILSGVTFTNANLTGATLTGAHLFLAELSGTNLTDANLTDVQLTFVDLNGTNLSGANLTNATLSNALWNMTECPDGTFSNTNGSNPESCCAHLNGQAPASCSP